MGYYERSFFLKKKAILSHEKTGFEQQKISYFLGVI